MHRFTYLVLPALLVLGLVGCGAPRPINYYSLQVPAAPAPAAGTFPIDLMVGRMTGSSLMEATPIVYRTPNNAMGVFLYHRWEDAPVAMVPAKLIRMLRNSGQYRSVVGTGGAPDVEFVVRGRLYDFTEIEGPKVGKEMKISGLVTMEFELYNRRAGKVLWTHYYSQSEPSEGKEITSVVGSIERDLDRGLKEVVAGLGQYFAANPPKKG
ncbi:MAG TPA: ABC-type transport auxiliary lipoprotein family protein [Verrucomicrobiae bacterium]|nr:ABC-type transport auxiliary lipoprotein family protein [Verrucomicrobiae bacterium]